MNRFAYREPQRLVSFIRLLVVISAIICSNWLLQNSLRKHRKTLASLVADKDQKVC